MSKQKCIHKYKKGVLGKDYVIYKCMKPACSHYIASTLVAGKMAECWRCGNTFIVTGDMVRKGKEMLKLHCKECTNARKPKADIVDDILTRIFGS
jgi:hypothetical protein